MNRTKLLSFTLVMALLLSLAPTFAVAESVTEGNLVIDQYLNESKDVLTVEAYATGESVLPVEDVTVPADIVLVLDQSGSMADRFDSSGTRQQALKKAAASLVTMVSQRCGDCGNHRISVVGFSNGAYSIAPWTELDETGTASLLNTIASLTDKPTGATYMDLGLKQAETLLNNRPETAYSLKDGTTGDRKTIVILFTDGYPGTLNARGDYFSNYYDTPKEADEAVAQAAKLKTMGATVFCVGAFSDADPSAGYTTTKKSAIWTVWRSAAGSMNGLMHFISCDYDSSCTSWRNYTASNDGRNSGYYYSASNTATLTDAFENIVKQAIPRSLSVPVGSSVVLKTQLSDYFEISGDIAVSACDYDAVSGTFGAAEAFAADVKVNGNTVTVTGFDYGESFCAAGSIGGKKLVLEIPVRDVVTEFGVYPVTSDISGIYSAGDEKLCSSPAVSMEIENYIDLSSNETLAPDVERYFSILFGDSSYYENLWPTMSSLRTVGDNIYFLDYQYDYDIDDLMATGVSSAAELLEYASGKILGDAFSFGMGNWGTGCSAFEAYNESGEHIMGRNFDYMDAPCYVVWTHPDDGYAAVSMVDGTFMLTTDNLHPLSTAGRFQSLLAPYLCLDGINETGFAISVLQIHADGTCQDTGKTDLFTTAMIRCCLDKCATVDEAIALFSSFDVQDTIALGYSLGCCFHYMVTDAYGNAAVIEYVNNEMRVTRASDTEYGNLFVTNFYLAPDGGVGSDAYDPEGMERYDIIAETLTEKEGMLSFNDSFELLSKVHLNYRHDNGLYDITTLWSCLYNNSQATMDLAARMDYGSIYSLSATAPMRIFNISGVEVTTPREGLGLH